MSFTPLVRLSWVTRAASQTIASDRVSEHLSALSAITGVGRTAAYELVPLDPLHQQLKGNLQLIRGESIKPQLLVFSELTSLRAAIDAEDEIRALPLEGGDRDFRAVGRALLLEVASVAGVHNSEYDDFAPAVQVGMFNMDSLETERDLSYWYEYHRFVPFQTLEGGVRARRFLTIWGPTKFSVIYEFVSRLAHSQNFIADPEFKAHDKSHESGKVIPHTIHHEVLSQSVGVKLPMRQTVR